MPRTRDLTTAQPPRHAPLARPPRIAPTAAKALRVVELLAADPLAEVSLAEMQRRLGFSHGNLHAICTTLVAMGYLRREPGERSYRLGPALLSIGESARAAFPSVEVALPFLRTLAAEFDAEAQAAMRSGDSIVVVSGSVPSDFFKDTKKPSLKPTRTASPLITGRVEHESQSWS